MSLVCFHASWRTQDHRISGQTAMTLMDTKHIVTVKQVKTKAGERLEITDTLGRVFSVSGDDLEEWAGRYRASGLGGLLGFDGTAIQAVMAGITEDMQRPERMKLTSAVKVKQGTIFD